MFPCTSTVFCFVRVLSVPRGVVGSLKMRISLQLDRQMFTPFGCFAPKLKYFLFLCAVTEQSSGMNVAILKPWTILERFRNRSKQHPLVVDTSSNRHRRTMLEAYHVSNSQALRFKSDIALEIKDVTICVLTCLDYYALSF